MEKNYKIKKNNKQILTKIATTKKIPLKCTCTSFVVYKQKTSYRREREGAYYT